MKKIALFFTAGALAIFLGGCSPEPGSDAWCSNMENKSASDFTMEEGRIFARECAGAPAFSG